MSSTHPQRASTVTVVLALLALIILSAAATSAAVQTTSNEPKINTTFDESVRLSNTTLIQVQSGDATTTTNTVLPGGGAVQLDVTTLLSFLATPLAFLDDAVHRFTVVASDLSGNAGSYPFDFTVKFDGQQITFLEPPFGGTRNRTVNLTIGSEFPSDCRYTENTVTALDAASFAAMRPFTVAFGNRTTHAAVDVLSIIGKANVPENEKVPFIVACKEDNGRVTPKRVSITYLTTPPIPSTTPKPSNWTLQQIALVSPPNYIATDATTPLTVTTDRGSVCRYAFQQGMATSRYEFATMRPLPASPSGNKTHSIASFLTNLGRTPLANETIPVAVSCDDGVGISYTLFPITYSLRGGQSQIVSLVSPPNGTTSSLQTSFTVQTEKDSECRYAIQATAVTTTTGFDAMKPLPSANAANTLHSLADFYTSIGKAPQTDDTTMVSVTCNDAGNKLTAVVFAVNFRTPTGLGSPITNTIVVVDPTNPIAYITVTANQDVWCAINGTAMLSSTKSYETFNRTVSGSYTEPAGSKAKETMLQICCENRVGLSTCIDQRIQYKFYDPVAITVTTPANTKNTTYQLGFTTDKLATCSVRNGGSTGTVIPITPVTQASEFTSGAITMASGTTSFYIECAASVGTKTNKTFVVTADNKPPVVNDIITNAKTCSLKEVLFTVNATDPAPSSGISDYQYQLLAANGSALVLTTNTTNEDVRVRNLKLVAGAAVKIRVIAWDNAGNPSVVREETVTATGDNDTSCDKIPPEVRVIQFQGAGRTNATLICSDDGVGCLGTFRYALLPVNQTGTCTVNNASTSQSLAQPVVVDKESYLCYTVPDRAGNELRAQVRVFINKTSVFSTPPIVASNGTCTDGVKNRDETGVDCGGYTCGVLLGKLCAATQQCISGADCASKVCTQGVCAASACTNGVKDGDESDVDCGGTCTTSCNEGQACTTITDCARGLRCANNYCSVASDTEEPGRPIDEPVDTSGGWGIGKLLLIAIGLLLLIGGSGGAILYDPRSGVPKSRTGTPGSNTFGSSSFQRPAQSTEPIARFGAPGQEHGDELSTKKTESTPQTKANERLRKRETARRAERESIVKTFDGPEDLTALTTVDHTHLEQAVKDLTPTQVTQAVKQLVTDEKITAKDAAIAVRDLEHTQGVDESAIEALRSEFDIEKTSTKETGSEASSAKKRGKRT